MFLVNQIYILLYYIVYQFKVIFPYWLLGLISGSLISVFVSSRISNLITRMNNKRENSLVIISAAILGAASPICMYGTVPMIASLGKKGVPQSILAAFMVSSILINPNLFILSFALGAQTALLRLFVCLLAGSIAGLLVKLFFRKREFYDFGGFEEREKPSSDLNTVKRLFKDFHRGLVKTAPYFLLGIFLTAVFECYFPKNLFVNFFGANKALGVLFAASFGVPVYVCGGGTIPLLKAWMDAGMGLGAAMAFMITGPATKITNLSAVKIILGARNFFLYIIFNMIFAILTGLLVDVLLK